MKVFISWSRERSKMVAEALHAWLPSVIQSLDPWMSSADIEQGANWGAELAAQLDATDFGIICLTPENRDAPWLLFEAGALSKRVGRARVTPYLHGLLSADVGLPLAQFQMTAANEEQTRKLVYDLNRSLEADKRLSDERIGQAFQMWWPKLEQKLAAIPQHEAGTPRRSSKEILDEILGLARAIYNRPFLVSRHEIEGDMNTFIRRMWVTKRLQDLEAGDPEAYAEFARRAMEEMTKVEPAFLMDLFKDA